jgi:hypothetical protein
LYPFFSLPHHPGDSIPTQLASVGSAARPQSGDRVFCCRFMRFADSVGGQRCRLRNAARECPALIATFVLSFLIEIANGAIDFI